MVPLNKPDSLVYAAKGMWMMLRGNPETLNFSLGLVIVILSAHEGQLKKTEKCLLVITTVIISLSNWMNHTLEQLRLRLS